MPKVINIINLTRDKFWILYGYTQEELMKIIDDDQSYARFLMTEGIKQTVRLSDGEVVDAYFSVGSVELPYRVGDTWNLK